MTMERRESKFTKQLLPGTGKTEINSPEATQAPTAIAAV